MAEDKLIKELELGVRELFRILVPGGYALGLAQLIAPTDHLTEALTRNTASGITAAFFIGLIGYALRAHERWFPYYMYFEKQRAALNNEIADVASVPSAKDNVDCYKYFLETNSDGLNERIHYFSSFYYMLVELSLISTLAAYSISAFCLFQATYSISPKLSIFSISLILLAIAIQLVAQFPLSGVKTKRTKAFLKIEVIAAILALLLMTSASFIHGALSLAAFYKSRAIAVPPLIIVGYLFWRLGEKHWRQVIGEQIVLVNVKSDCLIECTKERNHRTSAPEPAPNNQLATEPDTLSAVK